MLFGSIEVRTDNARERNFLGRVFNHDIWVVYQVDIFWYTVNNRKLHSRESKESGSFLFKGIFITIEGDKYDYDRRNSKRDGCI